MLHDVLPCFHGAAPTLSWSSPWVGTLSNMYMTSEEDVSLSCAESVMLDMSLASPGSTSSPLFLKNRLWLKFISTLSHVTFQHSREAKISPDDTRLLIVDWQHFDHHLPLESMFAISQLDSETILHVLRVIMHVHQIHTWKSVMPLINLTCWNMLNRHCRHYLNTMMKTAEDILWPRHNYNEIHCNLKQINN